MNRDGLSCGELGSIEHLFVASILPQFFGYNCVQVFSDLTAILRFRMVCLHWKTLLKVPFVFCLKPVFFFPARH